MRKKAVSKQGMKKSRFKRWFAILWQQFCEYCGHTALHGYQYLTEPGRHVYERLIWLAIHFCAILGATFMIYTMWRRYDASPIATAVESTNYPVWKVPFPAVTICDPNQVRVSNARRLAFRLSEGNKDREEELFQQMRHFRHIIKHGSLSFSNVSLLHGSLRKTGLSIEEVMRELTPSCLDLIESCKWKGEEQPCSTLFHRTKSDNGFCCSFNYAALCQAKNCSSLLPTSSPQFVSSSGHRYGLMVLIRYRPEERYAATISSGAMRVFLHAWYEFPGQFAGVEALVRRQTHTFFRVAVESTYPTTGLRYLSEDRTGCVYSEESQNRLHSSQAENSADRVHDIYRQDKCLLECRREHVVRLCGCQPYYYPYNEGIRLCDFSDLSCLSRYKGLLSRLKTSVTFTGGKTDGKEAMECSCPPQCQSLTYRYEATAGDLYLDRYSEMGEKNNISDSSNHSLFYVFFGQMTGTRYRRDLLFTWDTLLSNAGGLCGLFMGFSIISVVELFYFFTVRLFFVARVSKKSIFVKRSRRKIQTTFQPPTVQFLWSEFATPSRRFKKAHY